MADSTDNVLGFDFSFDPASLLDPSNYSKEFINLLKSLGMGAVGTALNGGFSNGSTPVGYQGGVPKYNLSRTQTPLIQQRPAGYRPGQGGITYFTPAQYTPTGEDLKAPKAMASGGLAGLAAGGSSDKGRFLKGPGDGVSDDIEAQIDGTGEPARLADGEFVIPARIVAEIGNGSSEAGARKLYALLDRVEAMARKHKRGEPSGADKELNKLA